MTDLLTRWSVVELASAVRDGSLSAVELLAVCCARVEARDAELHAFTFLDWDAAESAAAAVDAAIAAGEPVGPLAGIPFGVKDTQHCAGMPTRYGSLLHEHAEPAAEDDPSVARLRAAGAIPIGKTAVPEFASGLLCESRLSGTTRNPWNPAITTGGSSGGSAAAVASGMVPFATGTDGGGSIRIPGSICGLVGLKTTFGLVQERDRAISQTSTVGVLTWTVDDTAFVLDVMAGQPDSLPEALVNDPWSRAVDPAGALRSGASAAAATLGDLRVTYVPTLDRAGATPEVAEACRAAVDLLLSVSGATELPDAVELDAGANEIFVGAGSADPWSLFEFGDVEANAHLFTDYFNDRLARTGAVTVQELGRFLQRRRALRRELVSWFDDVDVIIAPTLSTTEIPAEGPPPTVVPGQEYEGVAAVAPLTRIANLAGAPCITVPVGFGANGAPIGLQLIVAPGRDALALALGAAIEHARGAEADARPF